MNWYSATHPLHLCRFQPAAYATFTWVARDWPVGIQVWQTGRRKSTAWACTYAGHYGHGRTPLEATNRAMRRHQLAADNLTATTESVG